MRRRSLSVAFLLLSACSDEPPPPPPIGQWISLLSGSWTLAPGEERYVCVRATMSHDIDIARFRPEAAPGTHHTFLTAADDEQPDGVSDCSGGTNGQVALFASGYGTADLELPAGVAVRVAAGTQLLLNVHLLNASAEPLSGTTGTSVFLLDPAAVEIGAEVVLAGKVSGLEVVPGDSTQTGVCTFPAASNIYAVMPHMHARGSHMQVRAEEQVILDEPFDQEDQRYRIAAPLVPVAAGSQVEVVCGYSNPSNTTFGFGPLASDEMCYGILLRYPAIGGSPFCIE